MTKRNIFLLVWFVVAVSILAWTLISYEAQSDVQLKSEILLRHGILMMVLTLPGGWLLSALVSAVVSLVGFEVAGVGDVLLVSLTCTAAGYLQWFVILPWLWHKWKAQGAEAASSK